MRFLERFARFARRALPDRLFGVLSSVATAFLTPIVFSYVTGHFRSSLLRRAVDMRGKPTLWITYPTIHFLEGKDFKGRAVLEWGAGQSTLWWSKRATLVESFEEDPRWFEYLRKRAPSNVSLHLVHRDLTDLPRSLSRQQFDVIVIDGLDRFECAKTSLPLLKEDAALILDNSDIPWDPAGMDRYLILELLRRHGFQRIDFYGHAPGVLRPYSTSLFFRSKCFLLVGDETPRRYHYEAGVKE